VENSKHGSFPSLNNGTELRLSSAKSLSTGWIAAKFLTPAQPYREEFSFDITLHSIANPSGGMTILAIWLLLNLSFVVVFVLWKLGEVSCRLLCKKMCGWYQTIVTITSDQAGDRRGPAHAIASAP
jgi:hypothetical protein